MKVYIEKTLGKGKENEWYYLICEEMGEEFGPFKSHELPFEMEHIASEVWDQAGVEIEYVFKAEF